MDELVEHWTVLDTAEETWFTTITARLRPEVRAPGAGLVAAAGGCLAPVATAGGGGGDGAGGTAGGAGAGSDRWDVIDANYDQVIKYATATRTGAA
ncbi:hypothetical protein [Microbispora sp. GKU 823]|uniref:hypothetical protein n=1 Tax=Microbispora sp. GKU 823 TaxID=1652100 RepID=UPI0009A46DC3|nr:hypothetical protein [Microbispora sp. GKU 823]OPG13351.1 hypothetical protein B1L11_08900 [Microbispora sp. GKU 823]